MEANTTTLKMVGGYFSLDFLTAFDDKDTDVVVIQSSVALPPPLFWLHCRNKVVTQQVQALIPEAKEFASSSEEHITLWIQGALPPELTPTRDVDGGSNWPQSSKTKLEIFQEIAEGLARLFLEIPEVEGIALFGSVARQEENPSDVDLILLTATDEIPELLLDEAEDSERRLYTIEVYRALELLEAEELREQLDRISRGINVGCVLMPAKPTPEYLERFSWTNSDPFFLENVSQDYRLFDPDQGAFVPVLCPWSDWLEEQGYGEGDFDRSGYDEDGPLPDPPGGFSKDGRPNWGPRQVRTLGGVKPGNIFIAVSRDGSRSQILILSESFQEEGNWRCWVCHIPHRTKRKIFLADYGAVPYTERLLWNRTNYLLRIGRRRMSPEDIDSFLREEGKEE